MPQTGSRTVTPVCSCRSFMALSEYNAGERLRCPRFFTPAGDVTFPDASPSRAHAASMEQNTPIPSPEGPRSKLSEFMKSNFGDKVSFATFAQPETSEGEG